MWFLRRAYAQTENQRVALNRLQHIFRTAASRCFPGLFQADITTSDLGVSKDAAKSAIKYLPIKEAHQNMSFHDTAFDGQHARWAFPPKKPHLKPYHLRKTIAHFMHSSQIAFEYLVSLVPVDILGRVTCWDLVLLSWCAGFVDHVHARSNKSKPSVLVHRENMTISLCLTVLSNRLLSQPCPHDCRWFAWLRRGGGRRYFQIAESVNNSTNKCIHVA